MGGKLETWFEPNNTYDYSQKYRLIRNDDFYYLTIILINAYYFWWNPIFWKLGWLYNR